MNTQKSLQKSVQIREPKLLNVDFNQDQSCFAVCTENGFQIFSTYPMELKMERDFSKPNYEDSNNDSPSNNRTCIDTGIGIVKMLYKTNYVALVGGGKRPKHALNKLCIWDDLKRKDSVVLEFTTPILNVKLSRTNIIVVLKNQVLVYSFKLKPELITTFETYDNPLGLCDLAISDSLSVLAFPSRTCGKLHIVDIVNENGSGNGNGNVNLGRNQVKLINAHKNAIKCICLSNNGNMVASASELGTIIRIYDCKNNVLLYEFRRGIDTAIITDMKFSPNDNKLAVLSDKNTLHIYNIDQNGNAHDNIGSNKKHILKDMPIFSYSKYFKSTWSFVSKNVGNKSDIVNDFGYIGWADDTSVVIIWKFRGIWEKYDIILMNESNSKGEQHMNDCKWQIMKEGWRSI